MPLDTLTTEEVAASAYRACCHAGGVEQLDWEREGEDAQQRWLIVARQAQTGLLDFEGKPVHTCARWLCGLWGANWEALPPLLRLCWEAVARHLATLLDADDVEDVGALERSWKEWRETRMK